MAKSLGPEFTYDLADLKKVDPALVHYVEKAAVPTGLKEPRGVAVGPGDRLYVAGDRAVRTFDASGAPTGDHKTVNRPRAIAVAADSLIFVATDAFVERIDPVSGAVEGWKTPETAKDSLLTGIAVFEDHVFVADATERVVLHFNRRGALVNRIDGRTPGAAAEDDGFIVPSPYFDLAVAAKDALWIANPGQRRVECYTFDGTRRTRWGKASPKIEGFCGCCNPTHLAILPDGGFATSEKGLPRVKTYTASGGFRNVVAPPAAFNNSAVGLDVATDSTGRIYVLDPAARNVRVFVPREAATSTEGKP